MIEIPTTVKDISFPQIDYLVSHCRSSQNSNRIFHKTWKADSRIYMKLIMEGWTYEIIRATVIGTRIDKYTHGA